MLQEGQELTLKLEAVEKSCSESTRKFEEKLKFAKGEKIQVNSLKEKLDASEKELAIKDSEYDKQLKIQRGGNNVIENLPVKHSQLVQELDTLQNSFLELENKVGDLYFNQIQKTTEVNLGVR